MNSVKSARLKEILRMDFTGMSKGELNSIRTELNKLIKVWQLTTMSDLRFFGVFNMYQDMLSLSEYLLTWLKE